MTRKRGARRKSLVRAIPLSFGFTDTVRRDAALQARTAVAAVVSGTAFPDDVSVLLRVSLYCNSVLGQLTIDRSVESDGLADAVEALNGGSAALIFVQQHLEKTGRVDAWPERRDALGGLVDAYEALLATATRRESVEALKRVARQAGAT